MHGYRVLPRNALRPLGDSLGKVDLGHHTGPVLKPGSSLPEWGTAPSLSGHLVQTLESEEADRVKHRLTPVRPNSNKWGPALTALLWKRGKEIMKRVERA